MDKTENGISSLKIILVGNLMVNLPVTVIITTTAYLTIYFLGDQAMVPAFLISSFIGWTAWARLIEQWRLWGVQNKIAPKRMFKLGKLGLINFYKYRIIKD